MKKIEFVLLSLLFCFAVYSGVIIYQTALHLDVAHDNHLVLLAEQFGHLKVSLSPLGLPRGDFANFLGRQYLYFGPFPSILLIPFALSFGRAFPQEVLGLISLVISFLAIYKISRHLKFDQLDSWWLGLFFCFSTALFFVSIINITAYQIQAIGTALILLSILEFFGKRRYFLIGLLIALAGMTRMTLFLSLIFYLFTAKRKMFLLLLPIGLSVILLGAYNYKRFHSVTQTGYDYNVTINNYPLGNNLKVGGQFNLLYLPTNLYSLLIKAPEPVLSDGGGFILKFPYFKISPWGLAIWFTSPLFLLLFRAKRDSVTIPALVSTIFLAAPSLLYYSIGFSQFGYRYSLDFLPFLFLLLVSGLKPNLPRIAKILIIVGILFNSLYMGALWGNYPLFGLFVSPGAM